MCYESSYLLINASSIPVLFLHPLLYPLPFLCHYPPGMQLIPFSAKSPSSTANHSNQPRPIRPLGHAPFLQEQNPPFNSSKTVHGFINVMNMPHELTTSIPPLIKTHIYAIIVLTKFVHCFQKASPLWPKSLLGCIFCTLTLSAPPSTT